MFCKIFVYLLFLVINCVEWKFVVGYNVVFLFFLFGSVCYVVN